MDKDLLGLAFVVGLVLGGGSVTGYMYLSNNSPLMTRQAAFNDTATSLVALAKSCSPSLVDLSEESEGN